MEKRPLVSVIIPAYNCAGLISRAIESVLIQEVSLEIIVIDDGSGDNLEQVLETYRDNPAFSFIKNKTNLGAAGSRNKGVAMAKGRYVAFLDADDYWAAGKLKKQTDAMERTGCVLSCTARELMTPQGELTGRIIPVKEEITYRDLLHHNSINCSSVVLKTEVAKNYPMEHDDSHEDYITWLKILQKYKKACGIREPLLRPFPIGSIVLRNLPRGKNHAERIFLIFSLAFLKRLVKSRRRVNTYLSGCLLA